MHRARTNPKIRAALLESSDPWYERDDGYQRLFHRALDDATQVQ